MSSSARIIKRYANRKLYDTQHSRYVTLEQISEMIRAGDDVKIIDNKSKEDLTSVTLAQIIFEEEKKQRSFLPLQAMRNIIQNGGESVTHLFTQAQKKVSNILPQKRKDADDDEPAEVEDHETYAGLRAKDSPMREFREWLQQSQRAIEDWQHRVDGKIRTAIKGVAPFSGLQGDVQELASRIAELEQKLGAYAESEAEAERLQNVGEEPTTDA